MAVDAQAPWKRDRWGCRTIRSQAAADSRPGRSGTRAQVSNAGQMLFAQARLSSTWLPLQTFFSPSWAQKAQRACCTNRGNVLGKLGSKARASISLASARTMAAQPRGY